MPLTRAEIQLIINAQSKAKGAFDDLSKDIKSVVDAAGQANKALDGTAKSVTATNAAVKDGTQTVRVHRDSLQDFVAGYIGARLTYDAFLGTFKAGVAFIKESIQVYAEHEAAVSHLTTVLANQKNPLKGNIDAYRELAKQIADTTNFTEDETVAAISNFITLGNLGPQQIQKAITASSRLATVMGTDLGNASILVTKYLEGNATSLQRAGVQVNALTPLLHGASAGLDELSDKLGAVDTAAKNTTAGGLKTFDKGLSDLEQRAGGFAVKIITPIAGALGTAYTMLNSGIEGFFQNAAQLGVSTADFIMGSQQATVTYDAEGKMLLVLGTRAKEAAGGLKQTAQAEDDLALKARITTTINANLAQSLSGLQVTGETLVQTLAKLKAGGASQSTIFQVLGGDADQAYKTLKVLEAEIPGFDKAMFAGMEQAADAVRSAGLDKAIKQVYDDTRAITAQSATVGLSSRIAGLEKQRDAAIRTAKEENEGVSAAAKLQGAIWQNAAAKIAAERIAVQRDLDTQLIQIESDGQKGIISATKQGSDAKLAILDNETRTKLALLLKSEADQDVIRQKRLAIEQDAANQRAAIIQDEQRQTVLDVIAADQEIEQSQIAASRRGLALKVASLAAQERAEQDALTRRGLTGDNYLAERESIENRFRQKRLEAEILNEREIADQRFALQQDSQKELIGLQLSGMQADLAMNQLELDDRLRVINLEHDADDRLIQDTIQLYHLRAIRIMAENDPVYKAWQGLNTDMRQDWADTWDQALHKTISWKDAVLKPFRDLRDAVLKIFAGLLADLENVFLGPLQNLLKKGLGAALSGVPGVGSQAAGAAGAAGLFGLGASPSAYVGADVASVAAAGGGAGAGAAGGLGAAGLAGAAGIGLAGAGIGALLASKFGRTAGVLGGAGAGAGTGALIGTFVMPVIGTAIGAIVGGLAGAIGGLFKSGPSKTEQAGRAAQAPLVENLTANLTAAQKAEAGTEQWKQEVIAVRDAYLATGKTADQAVADVKAFWDASKKGPEAVAAAYAPIQAAIEQQQQLNALTQKYQLTWADMADSGVRASGLEDAFNKLQDEEGQLEKAGLSNEAAVGKQAGAYNDLLAAALKSGTQIPPAFQPIILQLQKMGLLTDANVAALQKMSGAAVVDFKALTQTASNYGITLSQLGPKFQQADVHAKADQIVSDFEALKGAGADVGGVINGMADEVNAVVQESLKFKTDVPANMHWMIEALINSGQLLDENGNKITDISKIKFADPIEKQTDKLIDAIKHLTDAFRGLPDAAGAASDGVRAAEPPPEAGGPPPEGQPSPEPPPEPPPPPEGGGAKGVLARRPGLVLFGEGGESELGGPKSFFKDVLTSLGVGSPAQQGQGAISLVFNTTVLDSNGFEDAVHKRIIPVIVRAAQANRGQARTNLRTALGVT